MNSPDGVTNMTIDNMSQYSGIAASYAELPLITLRELESVLKEEIRGRLEGFGVVSKDTSGESGVGDFEEVKTVLTGENNVILVDFKRGNE